MPDPAAERNFQDEILAHLAANGWLVGSSDQYDRERAIHQYRKDRLPKDPVTGKAEPLLTFKRGALVHFAVSQYEVAMCTRLQGMDSFFLPFNQGTEDGGAGNDVPDDGSHPTSYLWREVMQRDNLLKILGRFVHLQVEEQEDWEGRKFKKETLIFPRYHQWDLVSLLVDTAADEGPGHCYLAQHSAGSGKSNSIAWAAHQLSSLYDHAGEKMFHSVIVITDRTVLDSQLQDTIYLLSSTCCATTRPTTPPANSPAKTTGRTRRWTARKPARKSASGSSSTRTTSASACR